MEIKKNKIKKDNIRDKHSKGMAIDNEKNKRNPEEESIKIITSIESRGPIAAENTKSSSNNKIGNFYCKHGNSEWG